MAKYADYVKDDIDDEIAEAGAEAETRNEKENIPDRFKGKSKAEIAASFVELQALNSKQANDLGTMRKTVDQLLELQSPNSDSLEPEKTAAPVSMDDLYEDADGNIRRVVKEESSDRLDALEERINTSDANLALRDLTKKFPDWKNDAQDPAFLDWVREKKSRIMLIQAADALDFEAAEELLGDYYDTKPKADTELEVEDKAETEQQLRDATLETNSPAPTELVDAYSRAELMEIRISAKHGNQKSQRWLAAHGEGIAQAYAEGRITD